MMMQDDNHQNHPMNELPVSSHDFMFTPLGLFAVSQYEHKLDQN